MKKLKIGVFGGGYRGQMLAKDFLYLNCDIVAVCENRANIKEEALPKFGPNCKWYDDFDEFLPRH